MGMLLHFISFVFTFAFTRCHSNRKGGHAQRGLGAAGGYFQRAGVGRRRVEYTLSLIAPLICKLNHFWGRGRTLKDRRICP